MNMHFPNSDSTLAVASGLVHRVAARLQSRLGRQVRDFQIFAHEEGLILRGKVGTYYAKQLAQQVTIETSGRCIVANEIQVL
jgi:hypothetical protein